MLSGIRGRRLVRDLTVFHTSAWLLLSRARNLTHVIIVKKRRTRRRSFDAKLNEIFDLARYPRHDNWARGGYSGVPIPWNTDDRRRYYHDQHAGHCRIKLF